MILARQDITQPVIHSSHLRRSILVKLRHVVIAQGGIELLDKLMK